MMDCTLYRRSLLADPHDQDPALLAHRQSCAECAEFTGHLLQFETRLERALRVPVPPAGARVPPPRMRTLAMAASLLLAVIVAGSLWLILPGSSLAADVVTHMKGEPNAWVKTDVPVPGASLGDVLREAHVLLAGPPGIVSYASSCNFRGHQVPHLVLQTEAGPVTVMVLIHDGVHRMVRFDEEGYRGVIVPVSGHGSLAVLTRGRDVDLAEIQRVAAKVQDSIVWTG